MPVSSDVIFDMNNQSERPGYGMQIARGATSLTEKWDASVGKFGSQNHFMLGQINEWFFHDLAGIQSDSAAPGFERIIIKPAIVGDLTHVTARYDSVRGTIRSAWKRDASGLTMRVEVPPGTTASIVVPTTNAAAVQEGDGPVSASRGGEVVANGIGCGRLRGRLRDVHVCGAASGGKTVSSRAVIRPRWRR